MQQSKNMKETDEAWTIGQNPFQTRRSWASFLNENKDWKSQIFHFPIFPPENNEIRVVR